MTAATLFDVAEPAKAAVLSDCGRYRYSLLRRWGRDEDAPEWTI